MNEEISRAEFLKEILDGLKRIENKLDEINSIVDRS
jgi:hypothetical protein